MPSLFLRGDHITLSQAVKAAGLAGSGGEAKHLIHEGAVTVNDVVETRPGRKLIAGDRFQVADQEAWKVDRSTTSCT